MHAGVMWKEEEGSGIDAVNVTLVRQLVLVWMTLWTDS